MKRKIMQHGPSSLIVSLPSRWVKQNGIKKGDQLDVNEEGNVLEIRTKPSIKHPSITIDVSELDRTTILVYLQSIYRKGYDEINVKFNNIHTMHYRKGAQVPILEIIQEVITRCIGVEIVKQSRNFVQIKQISEDSEKDFDMLVRRVIFLTTEAFRELEQGLTERNDNIVRSMEHHHKTITKFINYCVRLISKGTVQNLSDALTLNQLLAIIDRIVDVLKEIEREKIARKVDMPSGALKTVHKITEEIELFQKFFLTRDMKITDELEKRRDVIKREMVAIKVDASVIILFGLYREIPDLIQDAVTCKLRLGELT